MIAIYNWKIPSTSTTEMRRAAWVSDGSAIIEAVRVMAWAEIKYQQSLPDRSNISLSLSPNLHAARLCESHRS
jgi:hypothetical protein